MGSALEPIVLNTYTSYLALTRNLDQTLAATAKQPVAARETAYYKANISKVTSIDDLLKDTRLTNYVMKSFGLSDLSYAKGLIRKVLQGGVSDSNSLANQMTDPRFKALATAFDFAGRGSIVTATGTVTTDVVNQYMEQTLEDNAGQSDTGVQLALYFDRKASSVTSPYGILGDKALFQVVKTIFNIPDAISQQDITAQAATITKFLNVKDLQDPTKVSRLVQRFTAQYDAKNNTATTSNAILVSTDAQSGLGADLLLSLQNFKLGGL